MASLTAVQGDYGYTFTFNLKHANSMPMNLSNSTVQFRAKYINTISYTVVRDCTIAPDPLTGVCFYTIQDGDFNYVGNYSVEIVVTDNVSNKVMTAQGNILTINARKTL